MNKAEYIMPGVIQVIPDYSKPMPTREENEQWYREFMREIGCEEETEDDNNHYFSTAGVAGF